MIKYTVKKGDTLSDIAEAYNVTVSAIVAANPTKIKNPNIIGVGWVLLIPSDSHEDPVEVDADAAIGKAIRACLNAICELPEFKALEAVLNEHKN